MRPLHISRLIKLLMQAQKDHGDLPVELWASDHEASQPCVGISTFMGSDDEAVSITLCDPQTLEAFQ